MALLDRRAAWLLIAVLVLTALVGFSHGLAGALSAPRPERVAAGVDPIRDPVPNASPLRGPVLDEDRIRQIAREEANAAVGASARRRVAPPPPKHDTDAEPSTTASPGAAAATINAAPAAPQPTKPSTPSSGTGRPTASPGAPPQSTGAPPAPPF